jgi:hypothetical protein
LSSYYNKCYSFESNRGLWCYIYRQCVKE